MAWKLPTLLAGNSEIIDLPAVPSLRFELDGDWTCGMNLLYAETEAATKFYEAQSSGQARIVIYEDSHVRFSGGLAPFRESTDANQAGTSDSIDLMFKAAPVFPLEDRQTNYETNTGTPGDLVAQDAGAIAQQIMNDAEADHPTGIRVGTAATTTGREKSFTLKNAWDAIREMTGAQIDGGFDLDVTCLDPSVEVDGALAEVNIVAALGTDVSSSVVFAHGPGTDDNCLSVTREWIKPRNRVTATVNHAILGTPVASTVDDTVSQALLGLYEYSEETPDAQNNADLEDRARKLLLPAWGQTVTFVPDPNARNCPRPWTDFWLGDTVAFHANKDGLIIDTTERITAIEIDFDEAMVPSAYRVEFGPPRVTDQSVLRRIVQRLYWLEQHA